MFALFVGNLLSSVMVCLGILYSDFSEGLPSNTLNRPLFFFFFFFFYEYPGFFLLWFLLLLRPISFGNKSCLILGIFVTDTCFV